MGCDPEQGARMTGRVGHCGLLLRLNEFRTSFDSPSDLDQFVEDSNSPGVTWVVGGGKLSASGSSGGAEARQTYRGFAVASGYVEADISQANNAGLIGRYVDGSNHYVLVLSDGSDDTSLPNYASLYKFVGGAATLLDSWPLPSWPRGTARKIRMDFEGSAITVTYDGTYVGAVSDTAFPSGFVGLRAWGQGVCLFDSFACRRRPPQ